MKCSKCKNEARVGKTQCESCASKARGYARRWFEKNRDVSKENCRKWRKANPEKAQINSHRSKLKKKGVTKEDFDRMMSEQNGCCAICKEKFAQVTPDTDHNHQTGEVRGLLCRACNLGLGKFNDDPELLLAALTYLKKIAA